MRETSPGVCANDDPHRGHLLGPGSAEEIAAQPESYHAVLEEIRHGIVLGPV